MASPIHFLLNREEVRTRESPGMLVLDFLRRRARLTGTKEGCKEGDCGACAVLVGDLVDDQLRYQSVTSCLMPLGELAGKHLVTIEGLNRERLTAVQESIVEEGASQCGFCTPGIVVSLTGSMIEKGGDLTADDIREALSGHLCRCTGYASLLRAGRLIRQESQQLPKENDPAARLAALAERGQLPDYFREIPERLRQLPKPLPSSNGHPLEGVFIAGGTDIYVQRGAQLPEARVEILNLHPEMRDIAEEGDTIRVGALTTFEEFARSPLIQAAIPEIWEYAHLTASLQIRQRATLGGNIVNASPIGDMTILLLALDTTLTLKRGSQTRQLPLEEFYKGYKILAKEADEVLTTLTFPRSAPPVRLNFEKVSKRKYLDIATVNSAISITVREQFIENARVSLGGVAPVPLLLRATGEYLSGQPLSPETVKGALTLIGKEISPISDVRGSATYKRLLAQQLFLAHFVKLFPEQFPAKSLLEALEI